MKTSNHLFHKNLEDCSLSVRDGGRRGESRELLTFGSGESSASTTDTNNATFTTCLPTTKKTIEEIWGSKAISIKETTKVYVA